MEQQLADLEKKTPKERGEVLGEMTLEKRETVLNAMKPEQKKEAESEIQKYTLPVQDEADKDLEKASFSEMEAHFNVKSMEANLYEQQANISELEDSLFDISDDTEMEINTRTIDIMKDKKKEAILNVDIAKNILEQATAFKEAAQEEYTVNNQEFLDDEGSMNFYIFMAETLEPMSAKDQVASLVNMDNVESLVGVVEVMTPEQQAKVLDAMTPKERGEVLDAMTSEQKEAMLIAMTSEQ